MEGLESLRSKLLGLSGAQLESDQVIDLLEEVIRAGGGVHLEVDDGARYKLIRRDGRFMLTKDPSRNRPSTVPPRR